MGLFGRIGKAIGGAAKSTRSAVSGATRKVLRRPAPEQPPTPTAEPLEQPPAPTAPPAAEQPPAPATPPGGAPAEQAGEEAGAEEAEEEAPAEGEEEEEEQGRPYYPDSVTISIDGDWQFSENRWEGTIDASFDGPMVKAVLDLIDAGEDVAVAELVWRLWDKELAQYIDVGGSDITNISES
ncbi:hypothetical protein [Kitasatospora acidiphila]|uniref:hypothetical protein n=1 Tax=Kitasatospora acidiphila TaxID=2567942 RepID=UPI003C74F23E